jgi:adenylylsulfate kinase-like enzyme
VILVTVTRAVPVLWLYGPSGVGKTTVAWELFTRLSGEGVPTGYVDIDQIGMCYAAPTTDNWAPEPASDPGRHRLKARNLDAVVANFGRAGARCVIVSGVVDPVRGIEAGLVPHAALRPCRLRGEPAALRARIARRGSPRDDVEEVLRDADAFDRYHPADPCVDTTGRGVAEVARLVRIQIGEWLTATGEPNRAGGPVTSPGRILWLCGPTGVGKSTVGWPVYQQVRRAGYRAAFVDLDQLGFRRPVCADDPGNHRLKAANLAAVWRTYHAAGAHCLIVVGPVDGPDTVGTYTAALPAATVTLCRLHASRDQLTERILRRGRGLRPTWGVPGDELTGQPVALLRDVADRAAVLAGALERAGVGDLRVDTDGRAAEDIAREIVRATGWADR